MLLWQVNGKITISPGRKHVQEPAFASFDECMSYYVNNDKSVTGLVARPTACIDIPDDLKVVAAPGMRWILLMAVESAFFQHRTFALCVVSLCVASMQLALNL